MNWKERKPLIVSLLQARKARLGGTRDVEVDAAIASLDTDDETLAISELENEPGSREQRLFLLRQQGMRALRDLI